MHKRNSGLEIIPDPEQQRNEKMRHTPDYHLRWNHHQDNLVSVMDDLLEKKTLTDVALGAGKGPLMYCHKIILATCSPYFRKLFVEVKCQNPIILLKDVEHRTVKLLLEYMYRGEVHVSEDDVKPLFELAQLLQVKGLCQTDEMELKSEPVAPPSPTVCTSTNEETEETYETCENLPSNSSQQDYTNLPLNGGVETPDESNEEEINNEPEASMAAWPTPPVALTEEQRSAVAAFANLYPFPPTSYPISQYYENASNSTCPRNPNHQASRNPTQQDTSILRSVLNPEQTDPTLRLPIHHQNSHTSRSRKRKNRPMHNLDRRNSFHSLPRPSTSRDSDAYATEDDNNCTTPPTLVEPTPSVSGYGTPQRHATKRYKKYEKEDLWNAIAAVQRGLSANKAAGQFKVPSRTLYDKIKKLQILPTRQKRDENISNFGNMQYDIGAGPSTSRLSNMGNGRNEDTNDPISMVQASFGENREKSNVPANQYNVDRENPSPRVFGASYQPQSPNGSQNNDDNEEAEDLTVSRRSNDRDTFSPNEKTH